MNDKHPYRKGVLIQFLVILLPFSLSVQVNMETQR